VKRGILGFVRTDIKDRFIYRLKLNEFTKIAKGAGYEILDEVVQTSEKIDPSYVFGKGKVEELKILANRLQIDSLIMYNTLNSMQKINLEDYLGLSVLDRYDLILEIFDQNAGDAISKLQIELARLERMIPYVRKRASILYFRDRPGPRSLGEYGYHRTIAQLLKRKKKIREKLEKYRYLKEIQREKRRELGVLVFTLCGFYGAGKTTLFNALTNLKKEIKGIPFTTLSSKSFLIKYSGMELIVIDTIGFAFDIDPILIKSFEVTLEDLRDADYDLLILDASDEEQLFKAKLDTSLEILNKLEINKEKILPVLNKTDLIDKEELISKMNIVEEKINKEPIYISAFYKYNIDKLLNSILSKKI